MTTGLRVAADGSQHRVGGYILRSFLAQGGMAELYLACPVDPVKANQVVVVKRVLPQFAADAQFARMFAREAQLASMLKHPNIVEVFGSEGVGPEECFFAMEYVHGPDLGEILRKLKDGTSTIPLQHALTIAVGMAAGLHLAHEHRDQDGSALGIVHRDVSPSNVMIAVDGGVKITDFGVAKALALTSFTQAGTRKGKLSYMSPEQAVADPVDRRTDIFAIGAVLFEMTTLERMFGGENELAVMHKLLFRERPKPSQFVTDYPPELEQIIMRAVAQKPDDRFDTALDLQRALESFAARAGLPIDLASLGEWSTTVIPRKPHPAQDPTFFDTALQPNLAPTRDATLTDSVGSATFPDGTLGQPAPTAIDNALATAVGHVVASDSYSQGTRPSVAPSPQQGVIVNQGARLAAHAGYVPAGAYPARTGPSVVTAPFPRPQRPKQFPASLIVGGAVLVAAVSLGTAVWYAQHRDKQVAADLEDRDVTEPAGVGLPPPKLDTNLNDAGEDPDRVEVEPEIQIEVDDDSHSTPDPASPAPAPSAETASPPATDVRDPDKRPKVGKVRRPKKGAAEDPVSEPTAEPTKPPVGEPAKPPTSVPTPPVKKPLPPPPPPKGKRGTDDLLPIGG